MKNNIKKYREEMKISQADLAEKAEVSRTIISQLENESRDVITSGTMLKLSRALNKSVEQIFLM